MGFMMLLLLFCVKHKLAGQCENNEQRGLTDVITIFNDLSGK